jgi:hypothetical protein
MRDHARKGVEFHDYVSILSLSKRLKCTVKGKVALTLFCHSLASIKSTTSAMPFCCP